MKVLVIAEDLRVSGTSEGQVSRSFVFNLSRHPRITTVDLLYFKCNVENHFLEKLGVQNSWIFLTPNLNGSIFRFFEKICHKLLGKSIIDNYKINWMKNKFRSFDFSPYDRIFIRSTGQSFWAIRASSALNGYEKKTVLYFHDPYPVFWDPGFFGKLSKIGLNSFLEMRSIVNRGFMLTTPSNYLSKDMRFLYGSKVSFVTIPHQFVPEVFDFPEEVFLKDVEDKIVVMYHGAIQLGRTLDSFLEAFKSLLEENSLFEEKVILILRIKDGKDLPLKSKYKDIRNIRFLDQVNAGVAYKEIYQYSDVNLVLEPSGSYSNILVGKAPLLASLNRPVLVLGPDDSELKYLLKDKNQFARAISTEEIKLKLKLIIDDIVINGKGNKDPFNGYFSIENYFNLLESVLPKDI